MQHTLTDRYVGKTITLAGKQTLHLTHGVDGAVPPSATPQGIDGLIAFQPREWIGTDMSVMVRIVDLLPLEQARSVPYLRKIYCALPWKARAKLGQHPGAARAVQRMAKGWKPTHKQALALEQFTIWAQRQLW